MSTSTCPVCLGGRRVSLRSVKAYRIDKEYTLYECNNCKSRSFDLGEYADVDLQGFYNAISKDESYITQRFIISKYWSNEVAHIHTLHGQPLNSVLDIGCRTGDFLLHFSKNMRRVGVELSEFSAGVARARGLEIHQRYVEDCDFGEKFDVVTAYAFIEHLAEPQIFLNKLTEIIKDDGLLVIMIPSYQTLKASLLEKLNIQWHMYSPPAHLGLYSREFLDGFLQEKGFILVSRRYTSGGMFNPYQRIPLAGKIFSRVMWLVDAYSPLNRFPVFDHMYSYYKFSG